MSTPLNKKDVGRSGHGIHFCGEGFSKYRDKCLVLFGENYYQLETLIKYGWNPFRLSGTKNNKS